MRMKQLAAAGLWLLLTPGSALAHSPIEGIGFFYNGLLHPVLVPAHLLLLVAVGVFFGQQGPKVIQPALAVFAVATVVGLAIAWFFSAEESEALVLVLAAVVGLLIALAPHLAVHWCALIALLAGLFLGVDSAQEELSGKDKLVTFFGSGLAIYMLVLYPMALADFFNKKDWQKIGIRVVGSWVAASSLLVLALSFSTQVRA